MEKKTYLLIPVGFVKYNQKKQGLQSGSTQHATPYSLDDIAYKIIYNWWS